MKISMTTIREVPNNLYWEWAEATIRAMKKVSPAVDIAKKHFEELLKTGRMDFTNTTTFDSVMSIYEIVER